MQILWGALRAASVETMGVLVVLWMLYGATGLPCWATKSQPGRNISSDLATTQIVGVEPEGTGNVPTDVAPVKPVRDETQRAPVRQWLDTLFPATVHEKPSPAAIEQRAEYTRQRLDHFSRLIGIAWRD